jgi:hypothetical protein
MTKAKTFHQRKKPLTEEDKIRRRAIVFGVLTLIFGTILVVWGIPLFINLVDFLGNAKSSSQPTVKQDIIPPPVPRFSYIPEATNSAQLEIKGVTEPEAVVKIRVNEDLIESVVNEEGAFELEKITLEKGENTIVAWAIDDSDNESAQTEEFNIIYDTEAPPLELVKPEDGTAVEDQTIEIEGNTEPDARVQVNEHVVIVNLEGKFTYNLVLEEGKNEINITAEDSAGNVEEKNLTVTYLP